MQSLLPFAQYLVALPENAQRKMLILRGIDKTHESALDIAATLLGPRNLKATLSRLGPVALTQLKNGSDSTLLQDIGLTMDGEVLPEVRDLVPDEIGRIPALNTQSKTTQEEWYPQAIAETLKVFLALETIARNGVDCGKRSVISASAARDIAGLTGWQLPHTHTVFRTLQTAGLVAPAGDRIVLTRKGQQWCDSSLAEKWAAYVAALLKSVSTLIRHGLLTTANEQAFSLTREDFTSIFPLLSERETTTTYQSITALSECGLNPIPNRAEILATVEPYDLLLNIAKDCFPDSISGVYIQPDLTVIVPGILSPSDQRFLWQIAEPKHIGIAQNLEITNGRLQTTMRIISINEILNRLEHIAITGIPQPLQYLLTQKASEVKTVRINKSTQRGYRSEISLPSELANQVMIDSGLRGMQFVIAKQDSENALLLSQLSAHIVHNALAEAGYPVIEEAQIDADNAADLSIQQETPSDCPVEQAIDILRGGLGVHSMHGVLLNAKYDQRPVLIQATSNGRKYEFQIKPIALSTDRLRGTDLESELERTIPLSAITHIEPLNLQ